MLQNPVIMLFFYAHYLHLLFFEILLLCSDNWFEVQLELRRFSRFRGGLAATLRFSHRSE